MTYGDTLLGAYYAQNRLPEWLPTDGLVYFDGFSELRTRAPTGQEYSQKEGGTAAFSIATLGGRKCLYKADADNQLTIGLQMPVSDHTWGVFAYDSLGTCTNQQVFDLRSTAGGVESTDILRFRNASDNIGLFNWRDSQSHSSISVSGKYTGGGVASHTWMAGRVLVGHWLRRCGKSQKRAKRARRVRCCVYPASHNIRGRDSECILL